MVNEILNLFMGFALGIGVGFWISYLALLRMVNLKTDFEAKVQKMETNIVEYMEKMEKKEMEEVKDEMGNI